VRTGKTQFYGFAGPSRIWPSLAYPRRGKSCCVA